MSNAKTLNITINQRKNYSLVVAMCAPFPAGTFTAVAQPLFSQSGTLVYNPTNERHSALPPANFFYYTAGQNLATVTWNGSVWVPAFRPSIPLAVNYNSSTGEASLSIPFGLEFSDLNGDPNREYLAGSSPRRYQYYVFLSSGGLTYTVGSGEIIIQDFIRIGPSVTVCHLRAAVQTGVEAAAVNPETGMTGGNS